MKPWMIFLHGLLGASRNWLRIVKDFEDDYQILNLDQRGHGKAPHPPKGYSPQDFAQDLFDKMNEMKIPKAILVGHSMGGRNALVFAQKWPQMVEKLVIEDIGPIRTYENGQKLIDQLKSTPTPFRDRLSAKEYFMGVFGDPKLGSFLYTHIVETLQGFDWDFKISMVEEIIEHGRSQDLWPAIKALRVPTLWIRGEESEELTRDEFEKILASNALISGVEIPGVGHLVHFEKPEKFVRAVKDFLNQP